MYLMLSMWGRWGTWSKNDGVGQLQIFLVDLEGGSAAELPGIEHKGGGDDTKVLEGFLRRELAIGERHGLFLVMARAVSAKESMRLVVQAPFQRSSRCGLLMRPVRNALQRSVSCGRRHS